jgi:hypothetical protein
VQLAKTLYWQWLRLAATVLQSADQEKPPSKPTSKKARHKGAFRMMGAKPVEDGGAAFAGIDDDPVSVEADRWAKLSPDTVQSTNIACGDEGNY